MRRWMWWARLTRWYWSNRSEAAVARHITAAERRWSGRDPHPDDLAEWVANTRSKHWKGPDRTS